jgi:hypothetical protein
MALRLRKELHLTLGRLFQFALGLSPADTSFTRRGFHAGDAGVRARLENVGRTFTNGYNYALHANELGVLARQLEEIDQEFRGFAFEGAATALTVLDHLTPWNGGRLRKFIAGPAAHHVYMAHVGVGWAIGRLPWLHYQADHFLTQLDPLLRWLAWDGYGFESGFFRWRKTIRAQTYPTRLSGYTHRVFDQGLGRSLWFVDGADVHRIRETIASFPVSRQSDLWSGVGLACAYAGGVGESAIKTLRSGAGSCAPHAAQGAAFAAKARQLAGNPSAHTELTCQILCGLSADQSATLTDVALVGLPQYEERLPAYEIWRQRIQSHFSTGAIAA